MLLTYRSIREILAEQKRILEETRQSLAERRAHLVQSNTTPRVPIHTTTAPQTFKPAIIVKVPGQERELPFKVKIMRKQEILHRQSSISPDKRTLIENWLEDMDKS